jgi:hypothetical protein
VLSTCEDIPEGAGFWTNLTVMRLAPAQGEAHFIPKLDTARTKRYVSVARWWGREVVYLDTAANLTFSRKSLVLAAVNKDGGAHVDSVYPPDYNLIRAGVGWSMTITPAGSPDAITITFQDAHLAALRQMGYEILNSPDILPPPT